MTEIVKMDEKSWRIEDGFVRYFLLEGNDRAVLIDSGASAPDAKEIAEKLTSLPIILLNTHGDGDHTAGTAAFEEIYMHRDDYEGYEIGSRFPDTKLCEVNDGDLLELGGRPLKIITIPGHTKGSIAILDIVKRRLYAGDSVQKGHIYMFGSRRAPEVYEDALKKLISFKAEYDTILASHDEPELPNDYAEKVLESWQRIQSSGFPYECINMFGTEVKSYTTENCGFFCDKL